MPALPTNRRKKVTISLAIFITILLAGLSLVLHNKVLKGRENILRQDLAAIRSAIDQYTLDKEKAPQSLQDLITANYLKEIPEDPMTRSRYTWITVQEDSVKAIDQQKPGIVNVHSGSPEKAIDGTTYDTW